MGTYNRKIEWLNRKFPDGAFQSNRCKCSGEDYGRIRRRRMSYFIYSDGCLLEKSTEKIIKELLSGTYIIIADFRPDLPTNMLLQNVLRFNKHNRALEIYTLFEDEESDQYNLRFEHAICFYGKAKEQLYPIIEGSLPECDLIFADRNNSINKKVVYGKSGKVYQNRG